MSNILDKITNAAHDCVSKIRIETGALVTMSVDVEDQLFRQLYAARFNLAPDRDVTGFWATTFVEITRK